jgi:hypothetical protein
MMIPVMTLALVTQLTVAIADGVPRFNLGPHHFDAISLSQISWASFGAVGTLGSNDR